MKIFVTGGTGFVGARLVPFLADEGHAVVVLRRPGESAPEFPAGVESVEGDPMSRGRWWEPVEGCDGAVNLAGAPIFQRWNTRTKALIRESRLATTRNLVAYIPKNRPFALVSASGIGAYGDAGETELDESSPLGTDFLASVAGEWEGESLRAESRGARVTLARFGIILGRGGGALQQMAKATRWLAGGALGSGQQWMAWVHREDVARGIAFLLENAETRGPYNFCAPEPARQIEVARTLGRVLRRPTLAKVPAFALRLVLGEFAGVALGSQRARPSRLLEAGFPFAFPDLEAALRDILSPGASSSRESQ